MTRLPRFLAMVALALTLGAAVARGQSPAQLIAGGQENYDLARLDEAVTQFHRALDPRLNASERERALAASYLAAIYSAQSYRDVARTWLRWTVRTVPGFALDTLLFGPDVQALLALASEGVEPTAQENPDIVIRWQWSDLAMTGLRGRLVARTTTAGAQIRVNDAPYAGPDAELIPNTYRLAVSAQGYRTWEGSTEVLPGASTQVIVTLEALQLVRPGFVYVNSMPWGLVSIDGREAGFTMLAHYQVPAGTHQLRIESPGYEPYVTTFNVDNAESVRLGTIPLRRATGRPVP